MDKGSLWACLSGRIRGELILEHSWKKIFKAFEVDLALRYFYLAEKITIFVK